MIYLIIVVKIVHFELYFNINIFNTDLGLFYVFCFSLIKYFEVCLKPLKLINLLSMNSFQVIVIEWWSIASAMGEGVGDLYSLMVIAVYFQTLNSTVIFNQFKVFTTKMESLSTWEAMIIDRTRKLIPE